MACTRRHFVLCICFLQMLTIIERQTMDFLGYMWLAILVNFFHFIFVIFGFFGAYQLSLKYIGTYSIWNVIFIGWNAFLICFYLNVGLLDRESDLLNLGTGSFSWFLVNGYGCKAIYSDNITSVDDPYRPRRPESVENCLVDYFIVELLGIVGALAVARIFMEEDDRFKRESIKNQSKKFRQSLYSLESGAGADTIRSRSSRSGGQRQQEEAPPLSPKPMTPRRVKRRSVMTRGASHHNFQSNNTDTTGTRSSRRHHQSTSARSSVRNSRRRVQHQNPVTKLIDQQVYPHSASASGHRFYKDPISNPPLTATNLKSLNQSADPIYYNMNSSSPLLTTTASSNNPQSSWTNNTTTNSFQTSSGGHFNPTYQHSTPNLTQMSTNNQDLIDELYNNRPPSVRSSYSNFHGARSINNLNNLNPSGVTTSTGHHQLVENVFSNLANGGGMQGPNQGQPQAIPQVPQRRQNLGRNSVDLISDRSTMAFLNNGPPAYNLNYHTPPDSETTM